MLSGSELDDLCIVANTEDTLKRNLKTLFEQEFDQNKIDTRKVKLGTIYNNGNNVDHLISLIR